MRHDDSHYACGYLSEHAVWIYVGFSTDSDLLTLDIRWKDGQVTHWIITSKGFVERELTRASGSITTGMSLRP